MSIFNSFKKSNIVQRKKDEALYSIVASEMESNIRHNGLWLKALELADGNREKQEANYIKLRVQSLKDDVTILSESFTTEKHISDDRNIEEFVSVLNDCSEIENIDKYFSGMSAEKIYDFINQTDSCDDYPIHIAIRKGRLDIVIWLIENGADTKSTNYWGNTPLETARKNEDQDAIDLLLNYSK